MGATNIAGLHLPPILTDCISTLPDYDIAYFQDDV